MHTLCCIHVNHNTATKSAKSSIACQPNTEQQRQRQEQQQQQRDMMGLPGTAYEVELTLYSAAEG